MKLYFNEKKFQKIIQNKKRKSFVRKILNHPLAVDLDENDYINFDDFNPLYSDADRTFFLIAGFKLKDFLINFEEIKILYLQEAISAFKDGETLIPVSGIGGELTLKNHLKVLKQKGIIQFMSDLLNGHYYLKIEV